MSGSLQGNHAVITGGGRGLGLAIATDLASLGANLSLMGRDVAALEQAAGKLVAQYRVKVAAVRCDVEDAAAIAQAFERARRELGEPSILVNNAGQAEGRSLAETGLDFWERMIRVNLTSVFLCSREVLPAMAAAGKGRVVNVASTAGLKGYSKVSAYCAAKHGVIGLTRSLAQEFARTGVTINAVCPGYAETNMTATTIKDLSAALEKSESEARQLLERTIPRRKLIQPEEVASAVAWLCSPGASGVTGIALPVAGGEIS